VSAYAELMAFQRDTEALAEVAGRLAWDQETVMPRGAAPQRADEMAALESILHERRMDPQVGEWLAAVEAGPDLGAVERAQVRLIRRAHDRAARVPKRLAAEIARVTSRAQGVWAAARQADDFAAFAPTLEEVVRLKGQEAEALAGGGDLYDALLEDFEPGATTAFLDGLFGSLRPRLVALRERVLGAEREVPRLRGEFEERAQLALSSELALAFGYDLAHGRIDKAVHPFSSGSGLDVRITTRTDARDPFNCFYSTIHEVGHAGYEQGVDAAYALTPVGRGVSMGVHESQSRIYENQLGRSRAFTRFLFGRMHQAFGDFGVPDAEAFYAAVNRVHPGFIRTEADEVHYNLHVLMRYDLERALLKGDLAVCDLPMAWNERFATDFGATVPGDAVGCLQDVHWSVGLIGYFPTYTLGNVYAGCLHAALRRDLPDLDEALGHGDPSPATDWLRDRVQRHGGLHAPREVVARACGAEPDEGPLLDYLEAKFGALYDL
jgi:carboxypeptidase Taq